MRVSRAGNARKGRRMKTALRIVAAHVELVEPEAQCVGHRRDFIARCVWITWRESLSPASADRLVE